MKSKDIIIIVLSILVVLLATYVLYLLRVDENVWISQVRHKSAKPNEISGEFKKEEKDQKENKTIGGFNECIAAGFAVIDSYPRECVDDKGITHTEVKDYSKNENLILDFPVAEQEVSSPLEIRGRARGSWFFEASFPVILTNWDGLIIAEGIATAEGDWMTNEFVPFKAKLEFVNDSTVSNRGALILQKDNPSGLPENDDALEITIFYKK